MSRMIAGGSYLLLRAQSAHLRTNYHGFGERKKEAGRGGKAVTELTDESAEQAEHAATLDSDRLLGPHRQRLLGPFAKDRRMGVRVMPDEPQCLRPDNEAGMSARVSEPIPALSR